MSNRSTCCCANGGTCPATLLNCSRESRWYNKFIRPIAFCIITSMLAMSVSHLCDKYSANTSFQAIRSDLASLKSYLNSLSMEVRAVMEARDDLNNQLMEVGHMIPKITEAIHNLRTEVSEGMDVHTNALLKVLSPDNVRNVVRDELRIYDADKTGRTDYALESLGGKILSVRNTETYLAGAPPLTLFGIPLCQTKNTPQVVIQRGVLPGECWAFKGNTGSIVIKLQGPIHLSEVSLEHIPQSISPTGESSTAPKVFSVWGLENVDDKSGFFLGEFTYDTSGDPIQYFELQKNPNKPFEIVELKIHSNNGNPEYTCIYRIRVHGKLAR